MSNARILGLALAIVGGSFLLATQSRAQVNQGGNHPPVGGIERHHDPGPTPIGGKNDGSGKIQPTDQAGFAVCFGDGRNGNCPGGIFGLKGRGCENSAFTGGALLEASGAAKVSKDTMHIQVTGMVPITTAIFMQGSTIGKVGTPFGSGLLCLTGPVIKIGVKSTIYGAAEYPQYGDEPICDKGAVPAFGATRYYQVLYRDEGAGQVEKNHFNLSNAWMTVWTP